MHKQRSFPLRIAEDDRRRARRLAGKNGLSENRFYSELIHEGLLLREQMSYFEKLREMRVSAEEGLTLLDLAPNVAPSAEDKLPPNKPRRQMRA